jgi:hypothetical protein
MADTTDVNVDSIIERLLEGRRVSLYYTKRRTKRDRDVNYICIMN